MKARFTGIVVALLVGACATAPREITHPATEKEGAGPEVELVGLVSLPSGERLAGDEVGGLSGVAWSGEGYVFLAVSDDPGQRGPIRFYRLRIDYSDGTLDPEDVEVLDVVPVLDRDGRRLPPTNDPESIRRSPSGSFFVGTEGTDPDHQPFVAEMTPDGRIADRLELPERFRLRPEGAGSGFHPNRAVEGLAIDDDGSLWLGVETSLVEDGPQATAANPTLVRLLELRLGDRRWGKEVAYSVDPLHAEPAPGDPFAISGLVELLGAGNGELLVLERSYVRGAGFEIRLSKVNVRAARDVSGIESLSRSGVAPAPKEPVVELGSLGIEAGNVEGMTFGPPLPDGRRVLVLVADDNFNPAQETQILVLGLAADE